MHDSARMLGKRGASGFDSILADAQFFALAVDHHATAVQEAYSRVESSDREIAAEAKAAGQFIIEINNPDVLKVLFEFNGVLVSARALLDRLVRVLQTPLDNELPSSIRKLCNRREAYSDKLVDILSEAYDTWGVRLLEYRDCLLHFWYFDQGLSALFHKDGSGRFFFIPDNPGARSPLKFRYDEKTTPADYAGRTQERCAHLANDIYRSIFERFLEEEFGDRVRVRYWEEVPAIDTSALRRRHVIELSPGYSDDEVGSRFRLRRQVDFHNGKLKYFSGVAVDKLDEMEGDYRMEDDAEIRDLEIKIAFARMQEKEDKWRKRFGLGRK